MAVVWMVGALSLSACVAVDVPPGSSDPAKLPAATRSSAEAIKVVTTPPRGSSSLGKVSTFACQRFAWEPSPTEETALILAKAEAAKLGANAIYGARFRYQNISLANNCHGTMYVTAEAIRIEP